MATIDTELTVFDHLNSLIISRRLQPGDRLPSIRELARKLDVSVVAARDALVRAESEGLIEIRSRSGAYVLHSSAASASAVSSPESDSTALREERGLRVVDGHQLYLCQAREVLEVELAGRAAARCRPEDLLPVRQALAAWLQADEATDGRGLTDADCRFHRSIAEIAGNPVMTDLLEQCLEQQLMTECSMPEAPADRRRIVEIHKEIYEALRDQNPDRARDAMRRHMQHLESNILTLLYATPDTTPVRPARKLKTEN